MNDFAMRKEWVEASAQLGVVTTEHDGGREFDTHLRHQGDLGHYTLDEQGKRSRIKRRSEQGAG